MIALHKNTSDMDISERVARISELGTMFLTDDTYKVYVMNSVLDLGILMSGSQITVSVLGIGLPGGVCELYSKSAVLSPSFERKETIAQLDDIIDDFESGSVLATVNAFIEMAYEYVNGVNDGKIVDLRSVIVERELGKRF